MNSPILQFLKNLVPLCELHGENFDELVRNLRLEVLPAGKSLFKQGDVDDKTYYILTGELALKDPNTGEQNQLKAGTKPARFPVDHHRPRLRTATAVTEVKYIKIDNSLLDILLTWDQNAGYVVSEIGETSENESDNDWMTNILRSKVFLKIPPANIQAIFMRIQATPVQEGDTIIKQGDDGDFYYMIKSGKCAVYRTAPETGNKELKIAELGPGQGFGEDALMSDAHRNATIRMMSDGVLMRLSKEDFTSLLKEPVLKTISYEEATSLHAQGAQWLDVRLQSEYQNGKIKDSLNIPLYLLRLNAKKLNHQQPYIVYCDSGRRAASATFILNEYGFEVYALKEGVLDLPPAIIQ